MANTLGECIARQRQALSIMLSGPLNTLAGRCAEAWPERAGLNPALELGLQEIPYSKFLFAIDTDGIQLSDTASRDGLVQDHYARDRSKRPYVDRVVPCQDFVLSDAYVSLNASRPSITAMQVVRDDGNVLGFVGVDFDLRDLPLAEDLYEEPKKWRQIKGDPAIRGSVWMQSRVESLLDQHMNQVSVVLEELCTEHGIFHLGLQFGSSAATVWHLDDPWRYRILEFDQLVNAEICLTYPRRPYPDNAVIDACHIPTLLSKMKDLRYVDETFYLRSGSFNIFNGIVALKFSCDGSHYIPYDEFLSQHISFWTGVASAA